MDLKTKLIIAGGVIVAVILIFVIGFNSGRSGISSSKPASALTDKDKSDEHKEWRQQNSKCENRHLGSYSDHMGNQTVLMITLDGFHPDYLSRGKSPAINYLRSCAVRTPFLRSVYPTSTFPNLISVATGLYPESHGIVANSIYDPVTKKTFRKSSIEDEWWGGEPMWVTMEKNNRTAAVYFNPGSESKIKGYYPSYYHKFNSRTPYETRVDTVLSWLDMPANIRPEFIMLYFSEPDYAAHRNGFHSKQVNEAIARVDAIIDRLMNGMHKRNIMRNINILLYSDHGMIDLDCGRLIDVRSKIKLPHSDYKLFFGTSSRLRLFNSSQSVVKSLKERLMCSNPNLQVYSKRDLPVRLHYHNNRRIEDLVFVPQPSSLVSSTCFMKAAHGYDPLYNSMSAFFMASGPAFKSNITVEPFENIELYNLVAKILQVEPAPNNGTYGALHHMLSNPSNITRKNDLVDRCVCRTEKPQNVACVCQDASSVCKNCSVEVPTNANRFKEYLLPFGDIHTTQAMQSADDTCDNASCDLINSNHIIGFDKISKSPSWVSFNMKSNFKLRSATASDCWMIDSRLPGTNQLTCDEINLGTYPLGVIEFRKIYPGSDADSAIKFVSEALPFFQSFWDAQKSLLRSIKKFTKSVGELNVIHGPIYRPENNDGPLKIPSYYFTIVTWCHSSDKNITACDAANLKNAAFVLPHRNQSIDNCQTTNDWLWKNSARVRDIELLTNLIFYAKFPEEQRLQLSIRTPISDILLDILK